MGTKKEQLLNITKKNSLHTNIWQMDIHVTMPDELEIRLPRYSCKHKER